MCGDCFTRFAELPARRVRNDDLVNCVEYVECVDPVSVVSPVPALVRWPQGQGCEKWGF